MRVERERTSERDESMSTIPMIDVRKKYGFRTTYVGNSLIRNTLHVGPYGSPIPRDLW